MKATEVEMVVTLTVEQPAMALPLNVIDLSEWVSDRLTKWITLPFDPDVRELMEVTVETDGEGTVIDYEEV